MSGTDSPETVDVIVIGAGSTGSNVAWYARDNGLSVVVVENELVGGECSYWACMPSKALLTPGHVLAAARRVPGAAAAVTGSLDVDAVLERRDGFVSHLDDASQVSWLEGIDATLVRGAGRLAGEKRVEVTAADGSVRTLTATVGVVLATGTTAALPPVDGLAGTRVWTNREVTTAAAVPARLVVLGGGVVGVEMAQAYADLGSEVTLLQRGERILEKNEPFVGEIVADALRERGVVVRTGVEAVRVARDGEDGPVTVTLDDGSTVTGDELLVAAGRRFLTDDIGLETVGITPDGPLAVDDQLRVTAVDGGWLYAAGDVNGRALLTHQGKYQARIVGDVLAGKDRAATSDHDAVPQVVFTDPEVAAVGLTEAQAREAGREVLVVSVPLQSTAGAALVGAKGRAQIVVDQDSRTLLGATFVGPGVGELLHAATVAIVSGITLERLWHAVPAFPTVSEVWLRLLESERGL